MSLKGICLKDKKYGRTNFLKIKIMKNLDNLKEYIENAFHLNRNLIHFNSIINHFRNS